MHQKINWNAKLKILIFCVDFIEKTLCFAMLIDAHETGLETHLSFALLFRLLPDACSGVGSDGGSLSPGGTGGSGTGTGSSGASGSPSASPGAGSPSASPGAGGPSAGSPGSDDKKGGEDGDDEL